MKDAEFAFAKDRTTAGRLSSIRLVQMNIGTIHFVSEQIRVVRVFRG
jgi:hypothetical protein